MTFARALPAAQAWRDKHQATSNRTAKERGQFPLTTRLSAPQDTKCFFQSAESICMARQGEIRAGRNLWQKQHLLGAGYGMKARGMNSLRKASASSLEEEELGADESGGLQGMCNLNGLCPLVFFKQLWEKGVQRLTISVLSGRPSSWIFRDCLLFNTNFCLSADLACSIFF